ncbi:MAG: hypothetical protein V2I43_16765 [Parvularcula sp.]|jgi:Ca2+-binding RTX toxin-like protein|nr:hypothetical protein [Parvularcula sp.]
MTQFEAADRFREPLEILDPFLGSFSPSGSLLAEQKTRGAESASHQFSAGCACAGCCGIASASDDVTFVTDFTALISSSSMSEGPGIGAFFTYSFPDLAPPYLSDFYTDAELATFEAFSEAYKELAREAVEAFVSISGLTAFEVSPGKGDVQFMVFDFAVFEQNAGSAGFAYYPSTNPIGSDIFIDNDSAGALSFELLLHELGHALGLKHPFDGSVRLETDSDNTANTVMSYTFAQGADGLGPLDIEAIMHLYGDENADGNQIASWSWDEATETLTQTGNDTDEDIRGVFSSDVIEGMGGNDEIWGGGGNDQLFGGAGSDALFGGNGSDLMRGDKGDDNLIGQNGNDRLFGGDGADYLDGGDGDDSVHGGVGDDGLFGGDGDDVLEGGDGFDFIDGGSGSDTAIFDGNRSAYDVVEEPDGSFLIIGSGEVDRLVDVEFVQFADQLVALAGDPPDQPQPQPPAIPEPSAPDAQMLLPEGALVGLNLGSVSVTGTSAGSETVRLSTDNSAPLSARLDPSFNRGGDTLVLPGNPASFSAARSGSSVTFFSDNLVVSVPVGVTALTIRFADGQGPFDEEERELVFDTASSEVMLGEQVLTAEPVLISDAGGAMVSGPLLDRSAEGALSSVVLSGGSDTLGLTDGRFMVVGTAVDEEAVRLSTPQETTLKVNFDPSFNAGGDRLALAGSPTDFTVARAGSSVTMSDGDMTVSIPVGTSGLTVAFDDGEEMVLFFDTSVGEIMLGDQVVTSDPGPVAGVQGHLASAYPAFDVASSELPRLAVDDAGLQEPFPLAMTQDELSRIDSFVPGG